MTKSITCLILAMLFACTTMADTNCNTNLSVWCYIKDLHCTDTKVFIHTGNTDFIDRALSDVLLKLEPVLKISSNTTISMLVAKIPDMLRFIPDIRERIAGVICRFQHEIENNTIEVEEEDESSPETSNLISTTIYSSVTQPSTTSDTVTQSSTTSDTVTQSSTTSDTVTQSSTTSDTATQPSTTSDTATQPSTTSDTSTYTSSDNKYDINNTIVEQQQKNVNENDTNQNNYLLAPIVGSISGVVLIALATIYVYKRMNSHTIVKLSNTPSFENPIYNSEVSELNYETPIPYVSSTYTNPVTYNNYHNIDEPDFTNYHNVNINDSSEPVYAMGDNPASSEPVYAMGDNPASSEPVYAMGDNPASSEPIYDLGNN